MGVDLLPHNEETYEKIIEMFKTENRVATVQATGTGKSYLMLKWIEDTIDDSIIVLTSSDEIIKQLRTDAFNCNLTLGYRTKMYAYPTFNSAPKEYIESLYPRKIILDEYHRAGATEWGNTVNYLLSLNPNAKVLGVTATPIRYLDNSRDMTSEIFDGNLANYLSLGQAIAKGILPPPIYVPVWYDIDNKIGQYQEAIDNIEDDKKRDEYQQELDYLKYNLSESYGAEDIFEKYMPTNNGKYIVFCRDSNHLEEMKKQMKIWLSKVNTNVKMYVTLSERPDREAEVKSFIDDNDPDAIKLIFSVNRLNEGVHVPGIDGVILLRPTESPIIYFQQIGRGFKVGGKSPVIFDMVNNYKNVRAKGGEDINALEEEILDAITILKENGEDAHIRNDNNEDIEPFMIFERMVKYNKLFEDLESSLFIDSEERWMENFECLKMFIEENGRISSKREIYQDKKLGIWIGHQKTNFKQGKLSKERQEKLESIGINLEVIDREEQWMENFECLKMFIEENNRMPSKREIYQDKKLGIWVEQQKSKANKGILSKDKQEKLESIGVRFANTYHIKWDETFECLKMFIEENNRMPRRNEIYKGKNLELWIRNQKGKHLRGIVILPDERVKKLESIGIKFIDTYSNQWDETFECLKMFIKENGRMPVGHETYNGKQVKVWILNQKTNFRKGKLSKERQEKLESLGVIFTKNEEE